MNLETQNEFVICKECSHSENLARWNKVTADQLAERQLCFSCNHWYGWWLRRDDPRVVRVKHTHYYLGDDDPLDAAGRPIRNAFKGFGGHTFSIVYLDKSRPPKDTDNLWCQGDIPKHWQSRLPDNANFLDRS